MAEYLVTLTEEKKCRGCKKVIEAGTQAVKALPTKLEVESRYYHPGCRSYRSKQQSRDEKRLKQWIA